MPLGRGKWGKRELRLWKAARAKFPKDKNRQRRYVYGTLRLMGYTPRKARSRR